MNLFRTLKRLTNAGPAWIRVLLCSGPRQVVNALTLYSVYDAKLQINSSSFESSLASFFDKIRALATEEPRQAVILSGMLFTLIIWIFSFLSLLLAALFFVFFLWSYIPQEDGGLTGFCERKVNKRLKQIVSIKINKAMAEEERKRRKAEFKAAKKNGEERPVTMKPSLPVLDNDSLPEMPTLNRADTFASFSEKPRSGTSASFEMSALGQRPPASASQFSSKSSLLGGAAEMGMSCPESAAPTLPPLDLGGYPPTRSATPASGTNFGSNPRLHRMASNASSLGAGYTASPPAYSETMPSVPPRILSPPGSVNNFGGPGPQPPRDRMPNPGGGRPTFDDYSSGRASPAPSTFSYRSGPMSPPGMGPDRYPVRSATNPMPPRGPPRMPPRSMTAPMQPFHRPTPSNGSQRSMTGAGRPYHQPSASNSSLRNMVTAASYQQAGNSQEYGYPGRSNPMAGGPGGYGNDGGWNQDLERGNGPRY